MVIPKHVQRAFLSELEKLAEGTEQLSRGERLGRGALGGLAGLHLATAENFAGDAGAVAAGKLHALVNVPVDTAEWDRHLRNAMTHLDSGLSDDLKIVTEGAHIPAASYSPGDNTIFTHRRRNHPAVLAHELGHAYKRSKVDVDPRMVRAIAERLPPRFTPLLSSLGLTGGLALAASAKDDASRERRLKGTQVVLGAGAALHAPQLAEEARATYHAIQAGRKLGKGREYAKVLLPAYASYMARPAAALAALGGVGLLRRKLNAQRKPDNAK